MPFGSVLIALGLFLLGGSYSIFRADHDEKGRTGSQVGFAVVLLLAGLLAIGGGVLRLI
ncbi:MAG: uncharacterized protein JWQ26_215 [Modestobacter sp.]|jgi:hypothetical protein|nr:uncharacterized protein [Modestobacter sp.]HEV7728470.1 hypothetical protein [Modestobacter sp.]